ncbi:hypothetical protein [Phenylobacterium sp.]|uniref:terminase small subunit-like protein n=1 Tax=Phenylobacterium sp. TaxID=1871053 RepID=UPI002717F327|nr:hypothetical protein [Phenylobacterium sp.]MDO8801710.1 hypothetical protein [Phenylobacterium sp.]
MGDEEKAPPILRRHHSSWNMPGDEPDAADAAQAPAAARTARPWRRYTEVLATVICQRVAAGESLSAICRDPGMPTRDTVRIWRRDRAGFAARLTQAQFDGRHLAGRGGGYCPHVAGLICDRLALGMSLRQACALEGMPGETTVYGWLRRHQDFLDAYARARVLQAHRRFDQVWEIAEAADKEGAFLAKVRIDAARWQASRLAPKRYGLKAELAEAYERAVEPTPPEPPPEEEEMMNITLVSYTPGVPNKLVRIPRGKD